MDNKAYLQYIRDYQIDINNVVSLNDTVPGLNLKLLNKRLHDAKEAFLYLHDNNLHMDSMLVAGHILEICSAIYYIKFAKDKLLNARLYVAKSTVQSLYDILEIDQSDLKDEQYKGAVYDFLDYLYDLGHLVLNPVNKEDKKLFNKSLVSKLRSNELNNSERIKQIKKYYEKPIVKKYIDNFIEGAKEKAELNPNENVKKLEEAIRLFYASYCRIKHASALLYPGHVEKDNLIIDDNNVELSVPAVFVCLDIISDTPIHFKQPN